MKRTDQIWIAVFAIILVSFAGVTVYSGMWPPVSVVESGSMQHSDTWMAGTINTGDIVFVKKVTDAPNQVVTYLQGNSTGYSTYSEYGSVILYRSSSGAVIIHRAMFYLTWHGSNPVVVGYDNQSWVKVTQDYVLMKNVGYSHRNLVVYVSGMVGESGYITVGDHNLALSSIYNSTLNAYVAADQNIGITDQPVPASHVIAVAYGEIPWFGLIKLNVLRAYGEWPYYKDVPQNSYLYLDLSSALIVAAIVIPYAYAKYRKGK
ncbi:hypothetical protein Thermo_00269 [Thermoplasmatales archaeon]|nr:hypothetical protein Thermo_00269 [Thermoplasmatales archaeon]